jgi:hypothetical protein
VSLLGFLRRALRGPIGEAVDENKVLAARALILDMQRRGVVDDLREVEFKVFSQWGDDGIIQYLLHHVAVEADTFVEFGVQNYRESNTRFLLVNDNWRGLIMDASESDIASVREDAIYWRHELHAVAAFIDRDNINRLIRTNVSGPIGLLSIDVDGNDYWIWQAIEAKPDIVVIEYNSHFGSRHAITIPYDASFRRDRAHFSRQYWGASLRALVLLGESKGYRFVGSNSAGNNAYFVRADQAGALRVMTADEGYVESRFRDSRDERGKLTYLSGTARLEIIRDMQVVDVEHERVVRIADLGAG